MHIKTLWNKTKNILKDFVMYLGILIFLFLMFVLVFDNVQYACIFGFVKKHPIIVALLLLAFYGFIRLLHNELFVKNKINFRWHKLKDYLIYFSVVILLIFIGFLTFRDVQNDELLDKVTQFIGIIVTVLLGVLGIIEFAYDNGLTLLVPSTFEDYKEKKLNKQTKHYLQEFFRNEAEYFSQHSNTRISFLLNQLGLSKNQFEQLKIDILEIKLLPLHNLEDAKEKIRRIIQKGNIILAQDGKNSADLVYKEVKYFLNFTDILFVEDYYTQIVDCVIFLIKEKCKTTKTEFNRILISNRGNFLLGLGVSQKLDVALVKVTEEPLILNSKSWIGNFSQNESNVSIIVHDVLVSGAQIEESIAVVKESTEIAAIFCIVNRLDYEGQKYLEEKYKVPIYCLVELKDDDIEKLRNQQL